MSVQIRLLGGFEVARDHVRVPTDAWVRRQAEQLVALLALSRDRRMHREQVTDALWPDASWEVAGPRLHKAAHYARRALGDPGAVVLRHELVALFPEREDVEVDVGEFTLAATRALQSGHETLAVEALEWYARPLLPDDPYEPWTEERRRSVRRQHLDLLRLLGSWDDLLAEEPADEEAHLALARARAAAGDPRGALLQLERLEQSLRGELGASPGAEARRLRDELERGTAPAGGGPARAAAPDGAPPVRLFGRRDVGDRLRAALDEAGGRRGVTVLVAGSGRGRQVGGPRPGRGPGPPTGLEGGAGRRRVGGGSVALLPGARGPQRALPSLARAAGRAGRRLPGRDRARVDRPRPRRTGENSHQRLFVAAAELMRVAAAGSGLFSCRRRPRRRRGVLAPAALPSRSPSTSGSCWSWPTASRPRPRVRTSPRAWSPAAAASGRARPLTPALAAAARRPVPRPGPDAAEEIVRTAAGLPFPMLELARARRRLRLRSRPSCLPPARAPSGRSPSRTGLQHRRAPGRQRLLGGRDLRPARAGAGRPGGRAGRGRLPVPPSPRARGLVAQLAPHERSRGHQRVAEALAALGCPRAGSPTTTCRRGSPPRGALRRPGRGDRRRARGLPGRAVPGRRRPRHAGAEHLRCLLSRRGDLLMALGDPRRRRGLHRGGAGHDRDPAPAGPGAPGPGGRGR